MIDVILASLIHLNNNYGYGDITGIQMDDDFKGGTLTVKRHSCHPETRRFRVDIATNTVYFAKHQTKWTQFIR